VPVAILYADIFSPSFDEFHSKLVEMSDSSEITYVLRFKPSANAVQKELFLSGYGVELAIKSTEYKVIDDRKVEGNCHGL
jgi:UDP-glucose:glycoprotein glucosyltransferase